MQNRIRMLDRFRMQEEPGCRKTVDTHAGTLRIRMQEESGCRKIFDVHAGVLRITLCLLCRTNFSHRQVEVRVTDCRCTCRYP
jgi:hypothetical protein